MIKVSNLSFKYSGSDSNLINNMTFSINRSDAMVVLGRNGIGKSTLLRILSGEINNYEGQVLVKDKAIKDYSIKDFASIVSVVFSGEKYSQDLLVSDYLLTGNANRMNFMQMPTDEQLFAAHSLLEEIGKEELFNKSVFSISAGEMQLVKIVRALIQNPEIIILDEPTSNLDISNQLYIIDLIKNLLQKDYTIIVSTHNPGHALELNAKVLLLTDNGYTFGETDEILTSNNLTSAYSTDSEIIPYVKRDIISFSNNAGKHSLYF